MICGDTRIPTIERFKTSNGFPLKILTSADLLQEIAPIPNFDHSLENHKKINSPNMKKITHRIHGTGMTFRYIDR